MGFLGIKLDQGRQVCAELDADNLGSRHHHIGNPSLFEFGEAKSHLLGRMPQRPGLRVMFDTDGEATVGVMSTGQVVLGAMHGLMSNQH